MAYLLDFTTIATATAAANKSITTAQIPEHVTGDVIVVCINTGLNVASIAASGGVGGSSWVQVGATTTSGTLITGAAFYKVAQSAAESCTLTFASATSHIHIFVLRDVDTTTPLDASNVVAATTASQFSNVSITTTTADCFLLHYNALDSTSTTPPSCHTAPDGNSHFIDSSDNGSTTATAIAGACAAWYYQRDAGATPTPAWNMSLTNVVIKFSMAFRNKSGGIVPAYIDNSIVIGTKLMDGHWWASATTRNNENFKATPLTVTSIITHLGTLTGTFDAGAQVVDVGLNPYSPAVSSTPSTSATALTGFELGFPTTSINMTTGWVVGSLMESGPKLANFSEGSILTGGTFLSIGSTTNYRIFQIMAKDNLVNCEGRAVFSVQVNQTQTQSGQSATPPTISSIDKLCILNRGNTAALVQYCCDFHLIQKIIIAGGTSTLPVDSEGVYNIGRFARIKIIQKQGSDGLLPLVPLQIGGGDAVYFVIDAGALQFPRIYNRAKKDINYHGADNAIGISYAGKSGDFIKHTNSVITSTSPYYWEINSAATSAATWDFKGTTVVFATVTLRPVVTFEKMSFSDCPTITTNSSTVQTCNITNSKVVCATLADMALVSNSVFTSLGTGYGIEVSGAASTITFTGNTFTGYAASNGTTGNEAIFVNIATGTVTINISGGTTPSIRTAGATVIVNNTKTLTLTGLITGSDIVIKTSDTNTALVNVNQNSGTTYAYNYSYVASTYVDIFIMLAGYVPIPIYDYLLANSNASLPISQVVDRNYI